MNLPTAKELNIRSTGELVYAALQNPKGITIAKLRKIAGYENRECSRDAQSVMLRRLDKRLAQHGIGIARMVSDLTYRLVPR
jgi:hypothetical protein